MRFRLICLVALVAAVSPAASFGFLLTNRSTTFLSYQMFPLNVPSGPQLAGAVQVIVPVPGEPMTLLLEPHSMRSDTYRLHVQTASGWVEMEPPAPKTYKGTLAGVEGSWVRASLTRHGMTAFIFHPAKGILAIEPASRFFGGQPATREHVFYAPEELVPMPGGCGWDESIQPPAGPPVQGKKPGPRPGNTRGFFETKLGLDADVEFYQLNDSNVSFTVDDMETVINAVEGVYTTQVDIGYSIQANLVRTMEEDPYSSTNSSTLLGEFQAEWETNQTGITRDLAHLFTGKDLDSTIIGVAYYKVACSSATFSYGLSQSMFMEPSATPLLYRTELTAHELGHNWGLEHCNVAGANNFHSNCCDDTSGPLGGGDIMCSFVGSGAQNQFFPPSRNIVAITRDGDCLGILPVDTTVSVVLIVTLFSLAFLYFRRKEGWSGR